MNKQETLSGGVLEPRQDDTICSRCKSSEDLQKHHIKYIPEDIVTLCRDCHKRVHSSGSSPFAPAQDANDLFSDPAECRGIPRTATVTAKEIYDNAYFYWNWRDGEQIKSKYICKLSEAPNHDLYTGPEVRLP